MCFDRVKSIINQTSSTASSPSSSPLSRHVFLYSLFRLLRSSSFSPLPSTYSSVISVLAQCLGLHLPPLIPSPSAYSFSCFVSVFVITSAITITPSCLYLYPFLVLVLSSLLFVFVLVFRGSLHHHFSYHYHPRGRRSEGGSRTAYCFSCVCGRGRMQDVQDGAARRSPRWRRHGGGTWPRTLR